MVITFLYQVVPDSREDSAGNDCKYRNLSSIVAASPAYFVIESTNPRQPLPCKRVPRRSRFLDPAEYSIDPRTSALFKSRTKEPAYTPLTELDDEEFLKFKALLENDTDRFVSPFFYQLNIVISFINYNLKILCTVHLPYALVTN